jgi:hypothetical protein
MLRCVPAGVGSLGPRGLPEEGPCASDTPSLRSDTPEFVVSVTGSNFIRTVFEVCSITAPVGESRPTVLTVGAETVICSTCSRNRRLARGC